MGYALTVAAISAVVLIGSQWLLYRVRMERARMLGSEASPGGAGHVAGTRPPPAEEFLTSSGHPARAQNRIWIPYAGLATGLAVFLFLLGLGIRGLQGVEQNRALLEPIPGGRETTGTVVSSQRPCDLGCSYQAAIRYTDLSGHAHMFTVPYQSDDPAVGSPVKVSYDPADPADVHDISRSPSTYDLRLGTLIFVTVLAGLAVLGMGTLVVLTVVRSRTRAKVLPQISA